jgi:hypothetical protein
MNKNKKIAVVSLLGRKNMHVDSKFLANLCTKRTHSSPNSMRVLYHSFLVGTDTQYLIKNCM